MSETDRLYGKPGDEWMHVDIQTVYENWESDRLEEDYWPDEGVVIEEWTTIPLGHLLMSGAGIAEWVGESLYDEVHEGAADSIEEATTDAEVIAAFEAARSVMASKMTGWSQADRKVATHLITFDETHEPLLDGEPLYVKSVPPSS